MRLVRQLKKTKFNYFVIGGGVPSEKQGKIAVWPRSGSCIFGARLEESEKQNIMIMLGSVWLGEREREKEREKEKERGR